MVGKKEDKSAVNSLIVQRTSIPRSAGGGRINLFSGEEEKTANPLSLFVKSYDPKQMEDDFEAMYAAPAKGGVKIIEPPYNKRALSVLADENNTLRPCIDAIVVNVYGQPSRVVYAGPTDMRNSMEAEEERDLISSLLSGPNETDSNIEFKKKIGYDRGIFGEAYVEVCRNRNGLPVAFYHVPAYVMRITTKEKRGIKVRVRVRRGNRYETIVRKRNFRRYVQVLNSGKKRFFKEFGDPRTIDPETGEVNSSLSFEASATEIVHLRNYHPVYSYGIPVWITQILSVLGSYGSELVNYNFFKDNAIPAMAILVSGGSLSQEAMEDIQRIFSGRKGIDSMNRVAILEALSDMSGITGDGKMVQPRVDIKPLSDARQKDELFQEYNTNCSNRIRSSMRLPGILIGQSSEYNYASANTSFQVADSQVFGPERNVIDGFYNDILFAPFEFKYYKVRTAQPRVVNTIDTIRSMRILNEMGAMTPNRAIQFLNELFNLNVDGIKEPWGDYPFPMVEEMVKTQNRLKGVEAMENTAAEPLQTIDPEEEETPSEKVYLTFPKVNAKAKRAALNLLKSRNTSVH